jgi:predicted 3-demethylubiquinone-9 3-methyltransferase (glyoxalase superfamily)
MAESAARHLVEHEETSVRRPSRVQTCLWFEWHGLAAARHCTEVITEVIPNSMLLGASDRAAAGRAQAAMLRMDRIDIAGLISAFDAD